MITPDWTEKYRPTSLADCALPPRLRHPLERMALDGFPKTSLLHGPCGTGKTATANALCSQIGADVLRVDGFLQKGTTDLRCGVAAFARCGNVYSSPKVVIIDEADGLNTPLQHTLRGIMDKAAANCSFLLLTNKQSALSAALLSRCLALDYWPRTEEVPGLRQAYLDRIHTILQTEQVSCTDDQIVKVFSYFPDFRQMLKQLQVQCGR